MTSFNSLLKEIPQSTEDLHNLGNYYENLHNSGNLEGFKKEIKPVGKNEDVTSYYIPGDNGNLFSIHINDSKGEAVLSFFDPTSIFDLHRCKKAEDFSPGLLRFRKQISVFEIQTTVYQGVDNKYMRLFQNVSVDEPFLNIHKNHEKLISGDSRNRSTDTITAASGILLLKKRKWKPSLGFKTLMQLDSVYADAGAAAAVKVIPEILEKAKN